MTQDWSITGEYIECCNCSVPCQCLWYEAPEDNVCNAGAFYNIDKGYYGDVDLDGLGAGFLIDQEGVLFEGGWSVVLLLDEAANDDQTDALETIFAGEAGGLFEALAAFVDEVVDVVSLPIEYSRENGHFEFEAGDVLAMEVDGSTGLGGEQGTVFPVPHKPPDQEAKLGKSTEYIVDFNDQFGWDFGGKNSYFGEFEAGTA